MRFNLNRRKRKPGILRSCAEQRIRGQRVHASTIEIRIAYRRIGGGKAGLIRGPRQRDGDKYHIAVAVAREKLRRSGTVKGRPCVPPKIVVS